MHPLRPLLGALLLAGLCAPADAATRHHRRAHRVGPAGPVVVAPAPVGYAPAPPPAPVSGFLPFSGLSGALPSFGLPLAAPAGVAVRPEAARFMGYPYDVPGYRYPGYDSCLLRVGGPFGPGPSAGPCPFGLDRAF